MVRFDRDASGYPDRLRELRDPPRTVFIAGTLPSLTPSVAIVGARRASQQGRRIARSIARELAFAGVTIISGGALGVDIAAHEGALDANGRTLVVLPTPIDQPAPRENRAVFDRILAANGAWLSETPSRGEVARWSFCTRNRLIAALADLVLVIEASARSGTRYTIDAALSLGRPLAAIPWSVDDPRGAGCLDLLRGAGKIVTRAADVLAMVGIDAPTGPPPLEPESDHGSSPLEARVLALVARGIVEVEALIARTGAALPELLGALTQLELEGAIERRQGRVEKR